MKTIKEEIDFKKKEQLVGWTSRDSKNYEIKVHEYPFGQRMYAVPRDDAVYENLQVSRGIHVTQDSDEQLFLHSVRKNMHLVESDEVRRDELIELDKKFKIFDENKVFYEIGFRTPKVMMFVGDENFKSSRGCDIANLSVLVGKFFSYDVKKIDLSKDFKLNLESVKLIVCYHVLEHIPTPLESIRKIYDQSEKGTFFHVEVPIEPGEPRLRFAHVHEFQDGDLEKILKMAGWNVLHSTHETHSDGPFIDRVLCVKS